MIKRAKKQILFAMKLLRKLIRIAIIVFLALLLIAFGYYFAVTKDTALSPKKLTLSENHLTLYDAEGTSLHNLSSTKIKQTTPLNEISPYLKKALIATEDKRFYKHSGYDFKRLARAVLNNVKAKSFKEGASTISQQLIKNTHLTQEKTIKRKLQEWKLTKALERRYSKDDILEKYLNSIYFGHNCFGITSASDFYFGKTPNTLSLSESAILAGLIKSPNHYSPFKNPKGSQARKNIVLNAMLRNGDITKKEKEFATNEPLILSEHTNQDSSYLHFVFDELTELSERFHFTIGGKIEIYTYLNGNTQKSLQAIADKYTASDKTLIVLDGKTRGFKACVSTVGNIRRLPGSLIKPLLVYTPALEEDILVPATPILDEKVNYGGYAPENYDGKYHGYVSARECVEKSLNIPAVKTLETLTVEKGAAYLNKLGLPVNDEDKSLALALGGMKNGYTLKNLVSAYSALQSNGYADKCGFISAVKINGRYVYKKQSNAKRVFHEDSAYLMTDMLKSTAQNGTAKKLRGLPFEIAAKTGTVGTKTGNTDAYALSYTTRDCAAVWLGNANNDNVDCTGGGTPCQLLYEINEALYNDYQEKGERIDNFSPPASVKKIELDKTAYYGTHTLLLADENSPLQYRISELFKTRAIPLNKSTSFTYPTIKSPTLSVEENIVYIRLNEDAPTYYQYKIERYDYVTHTTLYIGPLSSIFKDDTLIHGKTYLYTITPIYNGQEGEKLSLPLVTTKKGEQAEINHEDILSKEWWEN